MTAQESRAMFEARMKQSPVYKPELMKWTDGRYELDAMESAYQGFLLGMEYCKPVARKPLSDEKIAGFDRYVAGTVNGRFARAKALVRMAEAANGITQETQG